MACQFIRARGKYKGKKCRVATKYGDYCDVHARNVYTRLIGLFHPIGRNNKCLFAPVGSCKHPTSHDYILCIKHLQIRSTIGRCKYITSSKRGINEQCVSSLIYNDGYCRQHYCEKIWSKALPEVKMKLFTDAMQQYETACKNGISTSDSSRKRPREIIEISDDDPPRPTKKTKFGVKYSIEFITNPSQNPILPMCNQ